MGRRPCGCDLIRDARQTGGNEGQTLEHFAKEYQLEWRCPFSGEHPEPGPGDARLLTEECQRSAKDAAALVGYEGEPFATCPCWYARQRHVIEAADARWHAEHGGLANFEPNPSQALFDAIHVMNSGVIERTNKEIDLARQRAEDAANAPPRKANSD